MTPLQGFASAIAKARSGFDSGGPWIAFYEAKQTAYAELIAALPEIEKVSHFWRYVQNRAEPGRERSKPYEKSLSRESVFVHCGAAGYGRVLKKSS
jgi:hypothetical protein